MSQSLVPLMPACGGCRAPQFNSAKPCGLCHFFDNLNFQFAQLEVVDKVEMKGHALQFVDYNTVELWEILPEFADMTAPYRKFTNTVCQLYPGSDVEQCWLIADMERLVEETSRSGISSPSPCSILRKTALPPLNKVMPSPMPSHWSFGVELATDSSSNFLITSPMTHTS